MTAEDGDDGDNREKIEECGLLLAEQLSPNS